MKFAASALGNSRGKSRSRSIPSEQRIVHWMDESAFVCLALAILLIPLSTATFREFGIAVFVVASLAMGAVWAIRQIIWPVAGSSFHGAELIALGAVSLVCFQLIELPTNLLAWLSPFQGEYLNAWGADNSPVSAKPWSQVSLTPSLTRSGLALLVGYVVYFLTLVQRIRTTKDVERVLKLVALASTTIALIGLGQMFVGNGKFLWMFDHPFRSASWPAKATFTNQNHFAHFLALGIAPLVWFWGQLEPDSPTGKNVTGSLHTVGFGVKYKPKSSVRALTTGALALVLFAGVLSFSRAGICILGLATILAAGLILNEWKRALKLALPAAAFAIIGLSIFGTETLSSRWESITNAGSVSEVSHGRFALWGALTEAIPHFWATGSGVGSHAEVYPTWLKQDFGIRFSHAESGYFQIFSGDRYRWYAAAACSDWPLRSVGHTDLPQQKSNSLQAGAYCGDWCSDQRRALNCRFCLVHASVHDCRPYTCSVPLPMQSVILPRIDGKRTHNPITNGPAFLHGWFLLFAFHRQSFQLTY